MNSLRSPETDRLFEAILKLQTVDECYALFEDLCTIKELKDLSQRLQVAFLLHDGLKYQDIAEKTGMSSATIGRVKRSLDYGSGGYKNIISKMKNTEDANEA